MTLSWTPDQLERISSSPELEIVLDLEADVTVKEIVDGDLRSAIDDAYRARYASYGAGSVQQMTSDSAAATTLRLSSANAEPASA